MSERVQNTDENRLSKISPGLVLHRVPDLKLHVLSDNRVEISLEEKTVSCGPHALAILDAFQHPTSFSAAVRRLSKSSVGIHDLATLTSTVVELYRAGVLRDETQSRPEASYGFGNLNVHNRMLNDRTRTSSFLAGIEEVVTTGDVVVDIGTGTGVLAVAAARAGAKHVYAIEASEIARSAEVVFEANGVADRITLVRGWSTRTTLPNRADVLVSEIIGNDPLAEGVLEVIMDARKRLLKPGARLIPSQVRVFALPVALPRDERMKHVVVEESLANWRSWYGIDFSPLVQVRNDTLPAFYVKPQRARIWETLGEPILLKAIDFGDFKYPISLDNTTTLEVNTTGKLDGLLLYFELELGPTTRLSTAPAQADRNNHWRSPVWMLRDQFVLQDGDRLRVSSEYRSGNYSISVTHV
jgi:precorrin-6B methylase 2